ncbi:MAG: ARMT1-like domain-containing protein [Planctomycetaceae bacterium]|nr:ARMT1-like domain-containing protein [Planctomycetaceae bacterium]
MPTSPDCIICLSRQSLDAARFVSDDPKIHEQVLRRSLEIALERGFIDTPPLLGQEIHREIRRLTGNPDPYAAVKKEYNTLIFSQIDHFREIIRNAENPLDAAARVAIGGNTIDFALGPHLTAEIVNDALQKAMHQPINGDLQPFFDVVSNAKNILYLLDNSGEIVCDRLLIEEILRQFRPKITAVVRGFPVINDATREDAQFVGLTELVEVIDNGNDGLGTILELCGPTFHEHLAQADLVIAKGLANYETLIEYSPEQFPKTAAYLFKAKCSFIAKFSGTSLGDLVVQVKNRRLVISDE